MSDTVNSAAPERPGISPNAIRIPLNVIKVSCINPFMEKYLYFDTHEFLADEIFVKNKVRVFFANKQWGKPGEKYCLVVCRIFKKSRDGFFKSLEQLFDKMLLCGNTDYYDHVKDFWVQVAAMKDKMLAEKKNK